MVIFGGTGDLTRRKLIPALCNLAAANILSDRFAIVIVARRNLSTESLRLELTDDIQTFADRQVSTETCRNFLGHLYFVRGDAQNAEAYPKLKEQLSAMDRQHKTLGNYLFYLALSPDLVSGTVRQLGAAGLAQETEGRWRRVIFEKPFGHDLESARSLNAEIRQVLEERQIYRIDHYLGKETVQNLLIFRFSNGIFEPIWNRRYIDHVQITAAETLGVGLRGDYYDTAGALRDMVPNHLFQLTSLTAMEPPVSFDADEVRDEQAKVLNAIQLPTPEEVLQVAARGQYGGGEINGEHVPAYRSEPRVRPDSATETFVALKLQLDNWRWADVPYYLRTGKRLAQNATEIVIQFKRAPFQLFRNTSVERLRTNQLIIHIQPDEGITLRFGAKVPGPIMRIGAVEMDFNYMDYFRRTPSTGYERLLYDCMMGDATLFQRADMIESAWRGVTPILDVWKALPARDFPNYPAGSWGPLEADALIRRDGREWRHIETHSDPGAEAAKVIPVPSTHETYV
jgi:glucose-6-phosphate 1-dehydrogenase